MITLVNLKNSNIRSVINSLNFLKVDYHVTNNFTDLKTSDKIILPGVGSFGAGMKALEELSLIDALREEVVANQKPFLGICLGMQLLFESSSESPGVAGLGFIDGCVERIKDSKEYSIPRIGWADSRINFDFLGMKKDDITDFYYIHTYHTNPKDKNIIAIQSENNIVSAIQYGNIYGCQFHPEKSHKNGLKLIKSFADLS